MIEVAVATITGITAIIVAVIYTRKKQQAVAQAEIPKLIYHGVFKIMDALVIKSDMFHVSDCGKQKALRFVLKNALLIFKDEMYQLADKVDGCERRSCSADQKMSHMINQNADAINHALRRIGEIGHSANMPESDKEVITLLMEKLLERISPKIDTLTLAIHDFAVLEAVPECKTRQYLAFTVWAAVMSTVYVDLQAVSDDINGDLNGMIFQDEVIGY